MLFGLCYNLHGVRCITKVVETSSLCNSSLLVSLSFDLFEGQTLVSRLILFIMSRTCFSISFVVFVLSSLRPVTRIAMHLSPFNGPFCARFA